MGEETKSCPKCAEQVLAVAKKCRHCGEFFDPALAPRSGGVYAPCPSCGCTYANPVSFTWWGGLLGPRLLTHVQCTGCRTAYNGKTGRSNTNGIIAYTVGALVVFGGLFGLMGLLAHLA